MRVGWLQTYDAIKGGAEITADLLKAAKPEDIEIVECPEGSVAPGLDAYVVSNCVGYSPADIEPLVPGPVVRYVQDAWPHGDNRVREWLLQHSQKVLFLSPLHVDTFAWDVDPGKVGIVPPPINEPGPGATHREGTVWLGQFTWAGKGIELAAEWGAENGGITFFGEGPLVPVSRPGVTVRPSIPYEHVPALLARVARLVHLPTKPEPFARTVAEGFLAGCEVVTNENAGALWWIRNAPDDLTRGAELFWAEVAECAA